MENRCKLLSAGIALIFVSTACAFLTDLTSGSQTDTVGQSTQALTETATPTPLNCETTSHKLTDAFEIKTMELISQDSSDNGENFCWGIFNGFMKNEYAVDKSVPVEKWGFVDFGSAFFKFRIHDIPKLNPDNTIQEIDTVIVAQNGQNVPFLASDTGGLSLTKKQYNDMANKHELTLYIRKLFFPQDPNRVLKTFRGEKILKQA